MSERERSTISRSARAEKREEFGTAGPKVLRIVKDEAAQHHRVDIYYTVLPLGNKKTMINYKEVILPRLSFFLFLRRNETTTRDQRNEIHVVRGIHRE